MALEKYPPLTEEDVTNLDTYTQAETDALLNTKAASVHNHTESNITDLDKYTQAEITNLLAGKLDKYTSYDNGSSLAIDGANGTYFKIATGVNSSFTFSNLATGVVYGILIKNSDLADDITITLPNTADILPALIATVDIPAGSYIEFSVFYDGTNRIWQISEELS